MQKDFYYSFLEKLHLIRNKLSGSVEADYILFCKVYNYAPDVVNSMFFHTVYSIFNDLNIYDINADAHKMIQRTMIKDYPTLSPALLTKSFLISTHNIISGYDLLSYIPIKDQYLCQLHSSNNKISSIAMNGLISGITQPVNFNIQNLTKDGTTPPKETPEEIKDAVFKYLYTFAILLEAEKSPLELEGKPRKLKNHFAKKAGVSKNLWVDQYVYLNHEIKRFYEEHTPMDLSGKKAVPTITKAHVRVIHTNGREKAVFIPSYVSNKWKKEKLIRNKVGTYAP